MLATDLILQKIQDLGEVKGCLIVGQDGLAIDSNLPESTDKELISAIISAILTETAKQSTRFKRGKPNIIIMETDNSVLTASQINIENESMIIFIEFKLGLDTTQIMNSLKQITRIFK